MVELTGTQDDGFSDNLLNSILSEKGNWAEVIPGTFPQGAGLSQFVDYLRIVKQRPADCEDLTQRTGIIRSDIAEMPIVEIQTQALRFSLLASLTNNRLLSPLLIKKYSELEIPSDRLQSLLAIAKRESETIKPKNQQTPLETTVVLLKGITESPFAGIEKDLDLIMSVMQELINKDRFVIYKDEQQTWFRPLPEPLQSEGKDHWVVQEQQGSTIVFPEGKKQGGRTNPGRCCFTIGIKSMGLEWERRNRSFRSTASKHIKESGNGSSSSTQDLDSVVLGFLEYVRYEPKSRDKIIIAIHEESQAKGNSVAKARAQIY